MNTYTNLDDTRLAQQAKHDHAAFDTLYRRHITAIYRYCYARTNTVTDAEDLTAQTFLAALETITFYQEQGSFLGWLFGIARHKCADFYRSRYADDPASLDSDAFTGDAEDVQTTQPEEAAVCADVLDCVAKILPQLSADRTEAIYLRYWGGLNMSDIAQAMRRTEAAVKMLISRAIGDLRKRCLNE
ncbi:MAG: RNA polymerase sigma factor [Anaerolineae bacterium]|nr:RNA polymerase sigma factor [Anaerolineae bacterium]